MAPSNKREISCFFILFLSFCLLNQTELLGRVTRPSLAVTVPEMDKKTQTILSGLL